MGELLKFKSMNPSKETIRRVRAIKPHLVKDRDDNLIWLAATATVGEAGLTRENFDVWKQELNEIRESQPSMTDQEAMLEMVARLRRRDLESRGLLRRTEPNERT